MNFQCLGDWMNFWQLDMELHGARLAILYHLEHIACVFPRGCLDLGATWTYKKKRRVPGVPGDSSLSYLYLLLHTTTPHCTTGRASFYIGGTTHNSRRYVRDDAHYQERARTCTGANQSTTRRDVVNERARTHRMRTHDASSTTSLAHAHTIVVQHTQPPSKGSLRGSKCTPLCNSQLPACKPIVCRRSQVSKSYIDAEQRRQRSSISILAVRRRARALSSRSDQ